MNNDRIALIESFIKEEPGNPFNYYALALEHQKSDYAKAIQLFQFLLKVHPDYLPTYYTAGIFLAETGNTQQAAEVLKKGLILAKEIHDTKANRELEQALLNLDE